MKRKIGAQVETTVYDQLKQRAADEHQPMGAIIQTAVADYLQRSNPHSSVKSGLRRLLARVPLKLSREQRLAGLAADYYDQ